MASSRSLSIGHPDERSLILSPYRSHSVFEAREGSHTASTMLEGRYNAR
jgi:hypothetical protein